ncbi:MAG: magnesium transporter [Blautia sp.]|nr:magnesium transporter [Blautia sp.]
MENELLEPTADAGRDQTAQRPDYQKEIKEIIRGNLSPKVIREQLNDYHENDIAEVLPVLLPAERRKLYHILDSAKLSDIFEYMDEDQAGKYLAEMDLKKAAIVISAMESDYAVDVLREIDRDRRSLLIELMDEEAQKDIRLLASYDEDEIGSRMTTNYIVIRENLTVKQAMSSLVEQASENDNISTLFVIDETGAFYGALDLKELIIARQNTDLEGLIVTSYPYVYGTETIDECIEKLKDYSEDSIPVLDNNNHMLGVITSQSIIEVVDDEMGEDYARLAGLTAEEDLKEPLTQSMQKRLPWLIVLLFLGMLVSTVVGSFEAVVSQLTLIMAFQSLILDMAGNVGTQSLAVTIRVLMDETLTGKQKFGLVGKEVRVGLCNGLILGTLSFVLVGLYIHFFKARTFGFAFAVSGCIGLALLVAMAFSSAVGTMIPLFFKKINVDPAVASGPLITTVNDLVAVVSYYGLSWILLINVMHLG